MIRKYRPEDLAQLKQITAICFERVCIDRNIETRFGLVGGRDWRWRKLRHIDADVTGDHADGVFVCELEGRDGPATIALFRPATWAWRTDLIEEGGGILPVEKGAASLDLGHHAIETVKLELGGAPGD